MMSRFWGSLQFLTVLPVPFKGSTPSRAGAFFPVVGFLLGAIGGGLCQAAEKGLGRSLAALVAIGCIAILSGFLHEDASADVADAFRSGRSRERILSVLKDSRIGSYGGAALILSFLTRWQALAHSQVPIVWGLAGALALSRASLVVLAAISRPAGEGLGAAFVTGMHPMTAVVAAVEGALLAFGCGWVRGGAMVLASTVIVLAARRYFERRLGGVNGDCLGATCQIVETANLLVLAWQR